MKAKNGIVLYFNEKNRSFQKGSIFSINRLKGVGKIVPGPGLHDSCGVGKTTNSPEVRALEVFS